MEIKFQATSSNLVIPFTDSIGRNYENRPVVPTNISFENACVVLDDEKEDDKIRIEYLRKSRYNVANGGKDFQELSSELQAIVAENEGRAWAVMPEGGLTEPDITALEYLATIPKNVPPAALKKWYDNANTVFARFKVTGIPRPLENDGVLVLRSKINLLLDLLERQNIWQMKKDESDPEGEKPVGQGSS